MQALLSILVLIFGLLLYAMAEKPKPQEIGKICFFAGLLAALLQLGGQMVSLIK
jgi:hypothetical protein